MRIFLMTAVAAWAALGLAAKVDAQGARRPPLFFHETWNSTRSSGDESPLTQANVNSPDLELHIFGAMHVSGANDGGEQNPPHTYSGLCSTACGIALSKKGVYADLRGVARIRIDTKMSGFHQIRPLIELPDGTWLVGDNATGVIGPDYLVTEFNTGELKWIKFDPVHLVTTGLFLPSVDLSKVAAVGFIDLMPGSGHGQGGWSDVGLFELYANASPANGPPASAPPKAAAKP